MGSAFAKKKEIDLYDDDESDIPLHNDSSEKIKNKLELIEQKLLDVIEQKNNPAALEALFTLKKLIEKCKQHQLLPSSYTGQSLLIKDYLPMLLEATQQGVCIGIRTAMALQAYSQVLTKEYVKNRNKFLIFQYYQQSELCTVLALHYLHGIPLLGPARNLADAPLSKKQESSKSFTNQTERHHDQIIQRASEICEKGANIFLKIANPTGKGFIKSQRFSRRAQIKTSSAHSIATENDMLLYSTEIEKIVKDIITEVSKKIPKKTQLSEQETKLLALAISSGMHHGLSMLPADLRKNSLEYIETSTENIATHLVNRGVIAGIRPDPNDPNAVALSFLEKISEWFMRLTHKATIRKSKLSEETLCAIPIETLQKKSISLSPLAKAADFRISLNVPARQPTAATNTTATHKDCKKPE